MPFLPSLCLFLCLVFGLCRCAFARPTTHSDYHSTHPPASLPTTHRACRPPSLGPLPSPLPIASPLPPLTLPDLLIKRVNGGYLLLWICRLAVTILLLPSLCHPLPSPCRHALLLPCLAVTIPPCRYLCRLAITFPPCGCLYGLSLPFLRLLCLAVTLPPQMTPSPQGVVLCPPHRAVLPSHTTSSTRP